MRFWVNNYIQAQEFVPHEPTMAIRIFDPGYDLKDPRTLVKDGNHPGKILKPNHWWVKELQYTFSDTDPTLYEFESPSTYDRLVHGPHCFNALMAKRILLDFAEHHANSAGVMIHCNAGLSRSPAVALALAHRFNIRPEWKGRRHKLMTNFEEDLKKHGRAANYWVYSLLMETDFVK